MTQLRINQDGSYFTASYGNYQLSGKRSGSEVIKLSVWKRGILDRLAGARGICCYNFDRGLDVAPLTQEVHNLVVRTRQLLARA